MAHHQGGQRPGTETVNKAPEGSRNQCGHDQHEIEGPDVHQGIDKRSGHEGQIGVLECRNEGALDITPPEQFFRRAYYKEQQNSRMLKRLNSSGVKRLLTRLSTA